MDNLGEQYSGKIGMIFETYGHLLGFCFCLPSEGEPSHFWSRSHRVHDEVLPSDPHGALAAWKMTDQQFSHGKATNWWVKKTYYMQYI